MRKRFFSVFCIPFLLFTLTSCGGTQVPKKTDGTAAATVSEDPAGREETPVSDDKSGEESAPAATDQKGSAVEEEPDQTADADTEQKTAVPQYPVTKRILPDNEALAFTGSLGVGWNLGNTLDAYRDSGLAKDLSDELTTETYWQPVATSKEIFVALKEAGFSSVRIPVSWHNHIADDDITISPAWLDRVNEIVDWALDADLKVILNIHHDNHPEANGYYPDREHAAQSRKYVGSIWRQLAERFKDYDDRLIFEALNEPRLVGKSSEWWFDINEPADEVRESIECIRELNQLFVDTVRSVEGTHRTCYLMCPGYCASPDGALYEGFELPQDAADIENRLIVSVHAYTPYAFALEEGGKKDFDPYSSEDTQEIKSFMYKLYSAYLSKGVPVVIDEFGARDKNGNLEARSAFAGYYTASAAAHGIPVFWWDNGSFSGSGEVFGILDRSTCEWKWPEIRDALVNYAIQTNP